MPVTLQPVRDVYHTTAFKQAERSCGVTQRRLIVVLRRDTLASVRNQYVFGKEESYAHGVPFFKKVDIITAMSMLLKSIVDELSSGKGKKLWTGKLISLENLSYRLMLQCMYRHVVYICTLCYNACIDMLYIYVHIYVPCSWS